MKLNENDIQTAIRNADRAAENADEVSILADTAATSGIAESGTEVIQAPTRKILVVGCGDGGSHIASAISARDPNNTFVILYNTNQNSIAGLPADARLYAIDERGAGKSREMSKDIFRDVCEDLLTTIKNVIDSADEGTFSYMLVCTTSDGGTGSGMSIILARLLNDNFDVPVMLVGTYPDNKSDIVGYYNSLVWQQEAKKTGFPYIIMDNSMVDSTYLSVVHDTVNGKAADISMLLTGTEYGVSLISQIDSMNLFRLTHTTGGRLVGVHSNDRPAVGQSLDDYIIELIEKSCQPAPHKYQAMGLWLKGPKDLISSMDVALTAVAKKYDSVSTLTFRHIEESSMVSIGALFADCDEPIARISEIRQLYDQEASHKKEKESVIDDAATGIVNPLGNSASTKPKKATSSDGKLSFAAFDD